MNIIVYGVATNEQLIEIRADYTSVMSWKNNLQNFVYGDGKNTR